MGPLSDPSIINDHLSTVPLVWLASPSLGIGGDTQPLSSLTKWPVITYAKNTVPYTEITRQFPKSSEQPARVITSSSLAICRRLVVDGMGISALPTGLVQDDLDSGLMQVSVPIGTLQILHLLPLTRWLLTSLNYCP